MRKLQSNSIDSVVTDPPYGLSFMGKKWDYDVPSVEIWKEVFKVLKHGGHLLSFAGTRTYHRMAVNIEDAGFEIRDMISWLYGSGFPKSLNIRKAIDKLQGNERITGQLKFKRRAQLEFINDDGWKPKDVYENGGNSEWEGWGTALKPACEPIIIARKPLSEKNIALNVLKWGTGGINIDDCRIEHNEDLKLTNRAPRMDHNVFSDKSCGFKKEVNHIASASPNGRFPANVILDEEAGKLLDKQAPMTGAFSKVNAGQKAWGGEIYGKFNSSGDDGKTFYNDGLQGASRFFYCAKASKSERNKGCEEIKPKQQDLSRKKGMPGGDNPRNRRVHKRHNFHPTVKPLNLMKYLVKLVTPKEGIVLDPFGGSGTTGIACQKEGFKFILFEKEKEYCEIARKRLRQKPIFEYIENVGK
ncbi:MAG: site-specific DNA-methyltransferase [Deltaproteobacteria bacterium]|nr:site-specific DNA-methyltransferase [Deltaproteobacteria bacterium]